MNQGDKPIENLTGNTRVQGMIYGPATYFSFPIILYNWHCPGIERKVLLGYKSCVALCSWSLRFLEEAT